MACGGRTTVRFSPFLGEGYLSRVAERPIDMDLASCDINVGPLKNEHLGGSQTDIRGEQYAGAEGRAVRPEQAERCVGKLADLGLGERAEVAPTAPLVEAQVGERVGGDALLIKRIVEHRAHDRNAATMPECPLVRTPPGYV